ncbi:MAG: DUF58 domain-containing protein [Gammaproteobacteria bacterium]|nr:DUF58 domain-containing protein [Gammaproteobacteria bacterium]
MRPTGRALVLVALLGVAALVWPDPQAWVMPTALLLGTYAFDGLWARQAGGLQVRRTVAPNLSVNRDAPVRINLCNTGIRSVQVSVTDELPDHCRSDDLPRTVRLRPQDEAEVRYNMVPMRRGDAAFGSVVCLVRSPLGLWQVRRRFAAQDTVKVYPDFAAIAGYLELLSDQQTVRLGIRKSQRRGEGLEFHQLREYRDGDTLRQVDWKATARRGALISREYQEERDQRVLFLIDSGRRMRTRDGSLSHFDHALNGMLLLAYIALRQGDSVGLKLFGAERKWVPPLRGVASLNVLLNEAYDLHSGPQSADYITAAEEVMTRQRKRSLVVLMTNLREEDADLIPALGLLAKRHVVVLANLRERVLDETLRHRPGGFRDALRLAASHDYLTERKHYQSQCLPLAHAVIDCTPQELPVKVVNAYWQVKRSGRL